MRNFPTVDNIAKKELEQDAQYSRGEVIETKQFGKMRGGGRSRGRGRGRGGRNDRHGNKRQWIDRHDSNHQLNGGPEQKKMRTDKQSRNPVEVKAHDPTLDPLSYVLDEKKGSNEDKTRDIPAKKPELCGGLGSLISSYGDMTDSNSEEEAEPPMKMSAVEKPVVKSSPEKLSASRDTASPRSQPDVSPPKPREEEMPKPRQWPPKHNRSGRKNRDKRNNRPQPAGKKAQTSTRLEKKNDGDRTRDTKSAEPQESKSVESRDTKSAEPRDKGDIGESKHGKGNDGGKSEKTLRMQRRDRIRNKIRLRNMETCEDTEKRRVYRYLCSLCDKKISNLPRHLREFHKFDRLASLKYSTQQRTKTKQTINNNPDGECDKDARRSSNLHQCPVENCFSVVRRIDKHLLGSKHKFKQSDAIYRQYINLHKYEKVSSRSSASSQSGSTSKETNAQGLKIAKCNVTSPPSTSPGTIIHDSDDVTDEFGNEITSFGRWLQTFGGGEKHYNQARQMVRHVQTVIAIYGQDFRAEIVCEKLQEIEDKFISPSLESKTASTVKNYLLDFKKFVEFGKLRRKDWITSETAERIVKQIQIWNRSLQKKIWKRFVEKKIQHRLAVVTTDHIKLYLKGKRAIIGNKILRDCLKKEVCNKDDSTTDECHRNRHCYIRARNYLIMLFCLNNATRAGPIINLKVGEVDAASENVYHNSHVVNVVQHKTMSRYGAAQLSLQAYHYKLLKAFVDHIRPLIPSFDAEKHSHATSTVFLSWSGRPLEQSEISNIVTMEFSVASNKNSRTSCTMVRKSVVSAMLESDLGTSNERDLASLMKHSDAMQKKTYDVRCSDRKMARMSNLVWKFMTTGQVSSKDLNRQKLRKT